ncbi:MAG TPA: hypothetical protein VHA30_03260 [Patescibacteria group bacterium]|nr:hypothetical protein [Patescibacteria group bacterium]
MDERKQLRFCAEMARQNIRASGVPEYAKQALELMLDGMPEVASMDEAIRREWVINAARAAECSPSETQALLQAACAMRRKPQ